MTWMGTAAGAYKGDAAIIAVLGTSNPLIDPALSTPASYAYMIRVKLTNDILEKPRLEPSSEIVIVVRHGVTANNEKT